MHFSAGGGVFFRGLHVIRMPLSWTHNWVWWIAASLAGCVRCGSRITANQWICAVPVFICLVLLRDFLGVDGSNAHENGEERIGKKAKDEQISFEMHYPLFCSKHDALEIAYPKKKTANIVTKKYAAGWARECSKATLFTGLRVIGR